MSAREHFRRFVRCVRAAAERVNDANGPESEFVLDDVETDLLSALKALKAMRRDIDTSNAITAIWETMQR